MVVNQNAKANAYMDSYNLYWTPTCYMDAGNNLYVGTNQTNIGNAINSAGQYDANDLELRLTTTWLGSAQVQVSVTIVNHQFINTAPVIPDMPAGPVKGITEAQYPLHMTSTDVDDQELWYMFDLTNMVFSDWIGPFASGEEGTFNYAWETTGVHYYRVKVKDSYQAESDWSEYNEIEIVKRGDANGDNAINIGDAVFIISYAFRNGPASDPVESGDANCDQSVNVGDAVFLISFAFRGGPAPGCAD